MINDRTHKEKYQGVNNLTLVTRCLRKLCLHEMRLNSYDVGLNRTSETQKIFNGFSLMTKRRKCCSIFSKIHYCNSNNLSCAMESFELIKMN